MISSVYYMGTDACSNERLLWALSFHARQQDAVVAPLSFENCPLDEAPSAKLLPVSTIIRVPRPHV